MSGVHTTNQKSATNPLVIVAVMLLVPLVGVLATLGNLSLSGAFSSTSAHNNNSSVPQTQMTPTVITSLPEPGKFITTHEGITSAMNFSVQYPENWQIDGPTETDNGTRVRFGPETGEMLMGMWRFNSQISAQAPTADSINQQVLLSFAQGISGFQQVEPVNARPEIAGMQWAEQDATYPDPENSQNITHLMSISVKYQDIYYNIQMLAPHNLYQEASTKYIQPILATFQFMS